MLGADVCINYKKQDFRECVMAETGGKGLSLLPYHFLSLLAASLRHSQLHLHRLALAKITRGHQDTISVSLMLLAFARNQPLESTTKAIVAIKGWFSSTLEERKVKVPDIKDNEVLIKVWAVGVNREDMVDVATGVNCFCPGLECSGIIEAVGRNVRCWKVGERVCAILEGGGYAERVAVPADFLLPLPDDSDLSDAAGLPYASCCIWSALFKMQTPETLKDKVILVRTKTKSHRTTI